MNYKVNTYTRVNHVTNTVNTTATMVAQRMPNRVVLIASNLSGQTGFLGVSPEISATTGVQILTGGNLFILKRDHYDLVTEEFWAINNVAGGTWWFLEQITVPEGFPENDS